MEMVKDPTASHVVFSVDGSVAGNSATDHPDLGDSHGEHIKLMTMIIQPDYPGIPNAL